MLKIFVFPLMALIISPRSYAGFERGNGGNIVFCSNEAQPYFLDFYLFLRSENKFIFPLLSPTRGSAVDKAIQLVQPLSLTDSVRTQRITGTIRQFEQEAHFIDDMPREAVDDEGLAALLETYNCRIHQLIFQRETVTIEGVRYFVSRQHWQMLNEDQKATAIVHEAVLREFMGRENFFYKDPVQIIVKGLLGYEMFRDESALERAKLQFDVLDEF